MNNSSISRRRFLSALGVGAASLPLLSLPGFVQGQNSVLPKGKTLLLIELAGGNDGLNTVIPVTDPAYRALRPQIGISEREALSLDRDTGLHPAMRNIADLWEGGEVQIVEGVGYPNPNRSHFRSIEIWNAGLGAESVERDGWVAQAFAGSEVAGRDADGLVLGGSLGPLNGAGRFSTMRNEDLFLETVGNLPNLAHPVRPAAAISPLDHVLATYESARITGEIIRTKLERSRARRWHFPQTDIGEQLRTAARLLDAGVEVPVFKVTQEGYDTHDEQPYIHEALLGELSDAIGAFAAAAKEMGLWQDLVVVTYSEFGRTARENASAGTDHGTAAPVFVLGGAVNAGLGGTRPSLEGLVDGDLAHTTDYRRLYAALLDELWGIDAPRLETGAGKRMRLLA